MEPTVRNRQVHLKRKVRPESVNNLETEIPNLRAAISRYRLITENLKDNIGWQELMKDLDDELKATELELEDFHKLTDKGRDYLLKQRQDLNRMISTIERYNAYILKFSDRLGMAQAELHGKQQRLRTVPE